MFNWSEFHLSKMTCYKIHTLRVYFPKYHIYCAFRDGTKDNYKAIRARCKAEGVSVGSIALAASYLAMAEIHAKSSCSDMSQYQVCEQHLTTITVELGFLWDFVLLLLKTCSLCQRPFLFL